MDRKEPFFSIGVTTFSRYELLRDTLQSIFAQTYTDFEVIVGNDNPARKLTAEGLQCNDPRLRIVNHADNLGELGNMNHSMDVSKGRYFTWLADDDLYQKNYLSSVFETLSIYQFPLCAYSNYEIGEHFVQALGESSCTGRVLSGPEFLSLYSRGMANTIGCYGFFELNYLKSIKGMESLNSEELGLYAHGYYAEYLLIYKTGLLDKIAYIDKPLIFYRSHPGSLSTYNKEMERYYIAGKNLFVKCYTIIEDSRFDPYFFYIMTGILKLSFHVYMSKSFELQSFSMKKCLHYVRFFIKEISKIESSRKLLLSFVAMLKVITRSLLSGVWHFFERNASPTALNYAHRFREMFRI